MLLTSVSSCTSTRRRNSISLFLRRLVIKPGAAQAPPPTSVPNPVSGSSLNSGMTVSGQMVLRWTAAGMLNAERSFRRIRGHKQMPQLVAALHRHAHPATSADTEPVGAAA